MMGGAKTGAELTSASATTKRAGAGTIGETAAIARRSASHASGDVPAAQSVAPPEPTSDSGQNNGSSAVLPPKPEAASSPEAAHHQDGIQLRRSRAGAGLLKDVSAPDHSAMHLILAGRAYSYGQNIVRKDDSQKPGDVLAIVS
jgi:hypothetical protein